MKKYKSFVLFPFLRGKKQRLKSSLTKSLLSIFFTFRSDHILQPCLLGWEISPSPHRACLPFVAPEERWLHPASVENGTSNSMLEGSFSYNDQRNYRNNGLFFSLPLKKYSWLFKSLVKRPTFSHTKKLITALKIPSPNKHFFIWSQSSNMLFTVEPVARRSTSNKDFSHSSALPSWEDCLHTLKDNSTLA